MRYIILILIILILTATNLSAQSAELRVFASAGQDTGHSAYTIGEPLTQTLEVATNDFTQGFHQTKLLIVSNVNLFKSISVKLFPNPVDDYFIFLVEGYDETLSINVIDKMGRTIITIPTIENNQKVLTNKLTPAAYYLVVKTKQGEIISTHKFIKR